jgi:hypothetical protein
LIDVSTRYVPHIVILVVIAAIPTLLHSLGRFDVDDCAAPEQILAPPVLPLSPAERKRLDLAWGEGNWSLGTLPEIEGAGRLDYVIARSFDPKTVYHWPESRVIWDVRPEHRAVEEVQTAGVRIPVHRAYYEPDNPSRESLVMTYLLVYHSRAVANPYLAQVLAGPREVVTGRRPMWLFLVYGRIPPSERREAEARARQWLVSAWERHRAACGS